MEGANMGYDAWQQSSLENKLIGIRDYARLVVELSRLRFDSIGSLYPGTTPGTVKTGPIAWSKFDTEHRRNLPIYDRGPWKSATAWLQASLTDTIQSMELIPDITRIAPIPTFDDEDMWQSALTVLPQCLKLVPEVVDEASDPYPGQFALAHMDLTPWCVLLQSKYPPLEPLFSCMQELPLLHLWPEYWQNIGRSRLGNGCHYSVVATGNNSLVDAEFNYLSS